MNNTVDFFHIGLPKCGSTYLQNLWTSDLNYQSIKLDGAVNAVREHAKKGVQYGKDFPRLNLNLGDKNEYVTMGSSEGFSWAYLNDPDNQKYIPYLHKVSARLLGETQTTNSILIIIRDPIRWIRAAHEQSIKQGNYLDMAGFIATQREFIENILDLKFIINCWGEYFSNVVVLPLEWLQSDEDRFWTTYENKLGIIAPGTETRSHVNKLEKPTNNISIGNRLSVLASLNELTSKCDDIYGNLNIYKNLFPEEFGAYRKNFTNINYLINRRISEYANDDELNSLKLLMNNSENEYFQQIKLDSDLARKLQDNYVETLSKYDYLDPYIINTYRDSIDNAL